MIYIFTSEPFPHGMASTNRIISFAHGFQYHNENVKVVCMRRTDYQDSQFNHEVKGIYRNIPFQYLSNSTVKSDNYLIRRLEVASMNFRLLVYCLFYVESHSLIIYYAAVNTPALILRVTSRLKRNKIIKEESEHPSVYTKSNNVLSSWVFSLIHYDLFDGLLLMTNPLIEYFRNEMHYGKPILHVPMSVDLDRFQLENVQKKKHIVYCGELNDEKDGVGLLIEAYKRITIDFPEYRLLLIGSAQSNAKLEQYHQMVKDFGIADRVLFLGKKSNDEMPVYLLEASVLVLPRPNSIQAQHGFPTKLGEYLATGNPVIVTSVGEIPKYLKDGVNAYVAEPGSIESLVEKFKELLENQTSANQIGINGKETALKYFNNRNQTLEILNFHKMLTSCAE
jgi:glycosyltransferase involved in cell wall biosynthesis